MPKGSTFWEGQLVFALREAFKEAQRSQISRLQYAWFNEACIQSTEIVHSLTVAYLCIQLHRNTIHTYTDMYARTHLHAYKHTHVHPHVHMHIFISGCIHGCVGTYIPTWVFLRTCMHTDMDAYAVHNHLRTSHSPGNPKTSRPS